MPAVRALAPLPRVASVRSRGRRRHPRDGEASRAAVVGHEWGRLDPPARLAGRRVPAWRSPDGRDDPRGLDRDRAIQDAVVRHIKGPRFAGSVVRAVGAPTESSGSTRYRECAASPDEVQQLGERPGNRHLEELRRRRVDRRRPVRGEDRGHLLLRAERDRPDRRIRARRHPGEQMRVLRDRGVGRERQVVPVDLTRSDPPAGPASDVVNADRYFAQSGICTFAFRNAPSRGADSG